MNRWPALNVRPGTFRLTIYYVAIIMILSAAFSIVLYRISTQELDRGLRRQVNFFRNLPFPNIVDDFDQSRIDQIQESKRHLLLNLIYFNIVIFLASGGLSYALAEQTLQPIEEALEAQKRFTADASHELRTPLTAMKTELEVALRDKKLGLVESRQLHESNLEEISKLETLSNGLLRLAQRQEGLKADELQPCQVSDFIGDAVARLQPIASQRSITVETDLERAEVLGDCPSLTELMTILLDNAIKYSPSGTVVRLLSHSENKSVNVQVIDQGMGIKASDLPFIFHRFYRADISRSKEKMNGYGLGLSIAKKIVDAHEATIAVESLPGQGTNFSLKFKQHLRQVR